MTRLRTSLLLGFGLALPASAAPHDWAEPGSMVSVSVEVEGREAPLYPAVDGSGRFYLEAREGARYALRLSNRTHERLGVAVMVDGLNVISGERAVSGPRRPGPEPGRMYILDPSDTTVIRGWRTSLQEVRRFTFVDERASYATRSGKANRRMGWIEVAVYREDRPRVIRQRPIPFDGSRDQAAREEARSKGATGAPAPPATMPAPTATAPADAQARAAEEGEALKAPGRGTQPRRDSYPGTGWGTPTDDRAVVVEFDPQTYPAERVTLRYEYGRALRALGILPRHAPDRDRLAERDRGTGGFAKPPDW